MFKSGKDKSRRGAGDFGGAEFTVDGAESAAGGDTIDMRVGRALNDYLDRKRNGERVTEDELLADHPDLADRLREHLRLIEELSPLDREIDDLVIRGILSQEVEGDGKPRLGKYCIDGVIGRGGMGIVLKAHDPEIDRPVALKLLRPELASDERAVERFRREARAAGNLRHPNIVTVYEIGAARGTQFIALEFVDGPSLAEVIGDDGPLSTEETRRIFSELLEGLAAAHEAGLIHRDIKSGNILLDGPQRRVKIADFGLARMITAQTRMTLPATVFGTPEYMSPEQARGDSDIDHRTDLYSAGVVLYEMLTGRTPFRAATPSAVIHRIQHFRPPTPSSLRTDADGVLTNLVMRLIEKRPADRLQSTKESLDKIHFNTSAFIPTRRRRMIALVSLVIVVCAALSVTIAWLSEIPKISDIRVDPDLRHRIQVRWGNESEWRRLNVPIDPPVYDAEFKQALVASGTGGEQTIILSTNKPAEKEGSVLFGLETDGKLIWSRRLALTEVPFRIVEVVIAREFNRVPGDELVVAANSHKGTCDSILVLDPSDGRTRSAFYHPGDVVFMQYLPNYFPDGRTALLAIAHNHALDGTREHLETGTVLTRWPRVLAIMILDPLALDGLAPPGFPIIDLERTTSGLPFMYAFLDMPYNADDRSEWSEAHPEDIRAKSEFVASFGSVENPTAVDPPENAPYLRLPIRCGLDQTDDAPIVYVILDRGLQFARLGERTLPHDDPRSRPEFWKARWRLLVREGEPVGDR